MIRLSREEARAILLDRQGLLRPRPVKSGRAHNSPHEARHSGASAPLASTLASIRRLGYVQIDTISVVERAQNHVLWTRNPSYAPGHLQVLQGRKEVFEYWAHAAAYLPIESYRFCLPRMRRFASGESHWFPKDKKMMRRVLDRIKREGPLRSIDFKKPAGLKSGPWWDWNPAKRALEQLFQAGRLMVVRRDGFQKVYGLPEDFLPSGADTRMPTPKEAAERLVEGALDSFGLASAREIAYQRRGTVLAKVEKALARMVRDGRSAEVRVEGTGERYFKRPETAPPSSKPALAHILSPFDNLVIQRKRLKDLFGFDYQIECYVPGPKRKFGYFCLPVLAGDRFVGRADCKAHRKEGVLEIRAFHLEPAASPSEREQGRIKRKMSEFAAFNGCSRITGKTPFGPWNNGS